MPCGKLGHDPTVKDLAARCVGGDAYAGLELVEALARMGVTATITTLVALAAPTMRISASAFDALADALDAARSLQSS